MSVSQINGGTQIKAGTVTNNEIAAGANIALTKLSEAVLQADGGQALTGNLPAGGFKVTGAADGVADTDYATYGQLKALLNGFDVKGSVRVATTGAETYTISGGAVTQIAGTTINGVSPAVADRILVKNAPAANGAGVADSSGSGSSQPANGIYRVTNATTNLTLVRADDADATGEVTAGLTVGVTEGTVQSDTQWTLVTNDTITLNTTALQFSQTDRGALTFSGGLTKTGVNVVRDDLTGDVTTTGNGNATTIAADAVTYAKMQNVAANSVVGNLSGSTADPGAVSAVSAATASTVTTRDANANTRFNSVIENFQSIPSAAGTTTLTVGSPRTTQITGATTQTVVLPDATTLVVGQQFTITNRSSGNVTVNANGGGLVQTMVGGSFLTVTVTSVGTSAGTWDAAYTSAGGSGSVTTVSVVNTNGFNGSVSTASTTPAITISTTATGVLKGNGTAISAATAGTDYYAPGSTDVAIADGGTGTSSLPSGLLKGAGTSAITAATAGTDYLAPSSRVTRETPSGTVNGSNTAFTLANTPISGTEEVYLNGLQQEPGAGNDYTISGATITYLTAPATGDKIRVSYFK